MDGQAVRHDGHSFFPRRKLCRRHAGDEEVVAALECPWRLRCLVGGHLLNALCAEAMHAVDDGEGIRNYAHAYWTHDVAAVNS